MRRARLGGGQLLKKCIQRLDDEIPFSPENRRVSISERAHFDPEVFPFAYGSDFAVHGPTCAFWDEHTPPGCEQPRGPARLGQTGRQRKSSGSDSHGA